MRRIPAAARAIDAIVGVMEAAGRVGDSLVVCASPIPMVDRLERVRRLVRV